MNTRVFIATNKATHLHATGLAKFDYPVVSAGSTAHFTVFYDPSLSGSGKDVAAAVLEKCEADYQTLSSYFGLQATSFNIIIAPLSQHQDGSGGAYHYGCEATDLYCDVQFHPQVNRDLTNALVIAEEVEVFQALQNSGWNCGGSNGEGLSRALAEVLYPGVLDDYSTAGYWLDKGRPDWVNKNNSTDTDPLSNGCSVLFLFWLNAKLGFSWARICQAGAPTLAGTYQNLTGKTDAWAAFTAAINGQFPPGQPSGVTKDNPFVG